MRKKISKNMDNIRTSNGNTSNSQQEYNNEIDFSLSLIEKSNVQVLLERKTCYTIMTKLYMYMKLQS